MSTGLKFSRISYLMALSVALLCFGSMSMFAAAPQQHAHKKAKKQEPPPPLPSGPTGVVPQVPLDKIAAVPPEVTYQDNQLTIVAPNSTLGDILRAVRKQTGAEIDVPNAPERVVTHLGPGSARDIIADLLNGSRFNYVLLGAPDNDAVLTRVVLVPKGPDTNAPAPATQVAQQPGVAAPPGAAAPNGFPQQAVGQPEAVTEPEADDNNGNAADDGSNTVETPAAEADQPPPNSPDQQQAVKTPQQMLQEMQQRQMQLQQQQDQQGQQAPPPGSGMPPHPPREQ